MTPLLLLKVMVVCSVIGVIIATSLIPLSIVLSYTSRLKADVSRRKAIRVFPVYAKYRLTKSMDWEAFVKITAKLAIGGALMGGVSFVFFTGLYYIFF